MSTPNYERNAQALAFCLIEIMGSIEGFARTAGEINLDDVVVTLQEAADWLASPASKKAGHALAAFAKELGTLNDEAAVERAGSN